MKNNKSVFTQDSLSTCGYLYEKVNLDYIIGKSTFFSETMFEHRRGFASKKLYGPDFQFPHTERT